MGVKNNSGPNKSAAVTASPLAPQPLGRSVSKSLESGLATDNDSRTYQYHSLEHLNTLPLPPTSMHSHRPPPYAPAPNFPPSQTITSHAITTTISGRQASTSTSTHVSMPPMQRPTFVHSPSTGYSPALSAPYPPPTSPSTSKNNHHQITMSTNQIQNHKTNHAANSPSPSPTMSTSAPVHASIHAGWQPYRDTPPSQAGPSTTPPIAAPSKLETESSPIPTSPSWDYAHAHPPTREDGSGSGLYGYRRIPSGLTKVLESRTSSWRGKLMGKEGGMGRALILGWVITTLGFLVATAFWRGELFHALDQLSKHLFSLGLEGKIIFGTLILITTIPPLPLYSTLMILAGYTFGIWEGFLVSYGASLLGAVLVFVVSRTLLRDCITKALSGSPTAQTLLTLIPQHPHLLLLIRIAPYPYNLLNVILASSPALTLKTYTACTALSLIKLFLHTWIGAGIHDISAGFGHPHHAHHRLHGGPHHHHPAAPGSDAEEAAEEWHQGGIHRHRARMYSTWAGIILCIGLFVYMTRLAKKALAKAQAEMEERDRERQGGEGMQFVDARANQEA